MKAFFTSHLAALKKALGPAHLVFRSAFLTLTALLLARFEIEATFHLFLLPLLAFALALGPTFFYPVLTGIILTNALSGPALLLSAITLIALFFLFLFPFTWFSKLTLTTRLVTSAVLAEITARCLFLINTPLTLPNLLRPGLCALFAFWMTSFALSNLAEFQGQYQKRYKLENVLFVTVLATLALGCLPSPTPELNWGLMATILTALILLKTAGLGVGLSYAGLVGGISLFTTAISAPLFIILFAPLPFLALIRTFPKLTLAFFYGSLYYLVASYLTYDLTSAWPLLNLFIPLCLFLLIDATYLVKLSKKMPGMKETYLEQRAALVTRNQQIGTQVAAYAQLFSKIGAELTRSEETKHLREVLQDLYHQVCRACPQRSSCYQQGDNPLFTLIPQAIVTNISQSEAHQIEALCLRPAQLLGMIKTCRQQYHLESRYNQEYTKLKGLLTLELQGVSRFLEHCQGLINQPGLSLPEDQAERIKAALDARGYDLLYVNVEPKRQKLFVDAAIANITLTQLETEVIPIIRQTLGRHLTLLKREKGGLNSYLRFILVSGQKYYITYGVSQLGKDFDTCGDSYRHFQNQDETILAISDGMGNGSSAACESRFTLEVLERMLSSGINSQEAINNLNILLRIKNRYDTYATLDLFTFNQETARAQFSKSGAYPSYLRRAGALHKIDHNAIPVGIVSNAEASKLQMELQPGDLIVMMSDGVEKAIDEVEQVLLTANENEPQLLAARLLRECQTRQVIDDITILVAQVLVKS